jgi:pimeloyl-ACP methyl ester carboxylesterase
MIELRHGRVSIALHERKDGEGPALLLLHALGGSAADWGAEIAAWPGRVLALDFSGHGSSGRIRGGAYYPEILAGDADAALAEIGPAHLAGAGIGAYVALLLAGARPDPVPGALLLPGAGLAGGGPLPDFEATPGVGWSDLPDEIPGGADPAVVRLDRDIRPVDYAQAFAKAARRLLLAEDGNPRPPWWEAVRASPSASPVSPDLEKALAELARTREG